MTQKIPVIYHDKNYLENLLRTTLVFKNKDSTYNFNSKQLKKILKDNEGYNITTQLANLYATSTKANNNITIINNMNKDNNNNEDVSEINLLKKEIEELKKENEELKCRKYPESSDEEDDKISKKKYDRIMDLKNKYWKESNEKDITIKEKHDIIIELNHKLDKYKKDYNIPDDICNKPLDICNEEFSDDEDEDDENTYEKMKEVEKNRKEKEQQEKQEEENKKTDREILIIKKEELEQMNKQIEKLELQLQDPEIDKSTKRKIGKEGRSITRRKIKLEEVINKMEQEQEDQLNSLLELDKE